MTLTVEEAQARNVCRICGGPVRGPFRLDYGREFAHVDCLTVEAACSMVVVAALSPLADELTKGPGLKDVGLT